MDRIPSRRPDISVLELMAYVSEVREDMLDMDMVSNFISARLELLKDVSCMEEAMDEAICMEEAMDEAIWDDEKLSLCPIILCSITIVLDSFIIEAILDD